MVKASTAWYEWYLSSCYLMRYWLEMDWQSCTRRIVSAKRCATLMMVHFEQSLV